MEWTVWTGTPQWTVDGLTTTTHVLTFEGMSGLPSYNEVRGEVPPAYDDVVYDWAYHGGQLGPQLAQNGVVPSIGSTRAERREGMRVATQGTGYGALPEERGRGGGGVEEGGVGGMGGGGMRAVDGEAMGRMGKRVGAFALLLFVANAVVLVASLGAHREFGLFYASNVASLLIFGFGSCLLGRLEARTRMWVGQLFFLALVGMVVVGSALTIVYASMVSSKIGKFCSFHEDACNNKTKTYKALGTTAVIAGLVGYFVLFTHYARVTFIHLAATERYFHERSANHSVLLYPSVRAIARYLPRYGRMWDSFVAAAEASSNGCVSGVANGFSVLAAMIALPFELCLSIFSSGTLSDDLCVWFCVCCCATSFCIGLVLCIGASGGLQDFGCLLLRIIVEFLDAISR